jgi:predicted glycogen debranching enzyme
MIAMRYRLDEADCRLLEVSAKREWLLTNGRGGYAMGTASGINTRRYHGHLVAAVRPPTTRMVLLSAIDAFVQGDGSPLGLSSNQYPGAIFPEGHQHLRGFSVDRYARWSYAAAGMKMEKLLALHEGEDAATLAYVNSGEAPVQLTLRPLVCHKFYHGNFLEDPRYPQELSFPRNRTVISHQTARLILVHTGAQRMPVQGWYYRFEHSREVDRGLDPRDDLFCPCELRYELLPGESAVIVASTEGIEEPFDFGTVEDEQGQTLEHALRDAARHFLVQGSGRTTIIAGYPWFTDWGRDTMISLPGLCLHTGRIGDARQILLDYASQVRQGLIPNRFVEQGETPDYNTVDATLWFANAIYLTLEAEWDDAFASRCMDVLAEIFRWHMGGTMYGIQVDPRDGLLTQGEPGVQLTWMDAKVGEWVVTPRHGKPVEINGLWINALRVMEWLASRLGIPALEYRSAAERAEASFDDKFWHPVRGHYLDTVDPTDASLRPNQVIAMALPFGPATGEHAERALDAVTRKLLTSRGLRTLAPDEPMYHGRFKGNLPELDAAYHQGTVWPWLLGPYASALLKINGDREGARQALASAEAMLQECGLGGIAEVYDGDEPQESGGCPWQAWSVAEILRAWHQVNAEA